jgi:hypothetical protein
MPCESAAHFPDSAVDDSTTTAATIAGADSQHASNGSTPTSKTISTSHSPAVVGSWTSSLIDLYDLSFLVTPYIFTPWRFVEIYFLALPPRIISTSPAMGIFSSAPAFDPVKDIKTLDGKVVLVTGG